ncbi:tripartite tricarboxylate transporter TctB family protein [Candidatus Uabimicrobium sp. HlEnr_7]|uniref:tripartite tricarboxylate transporter TctB family protein n=1 Tax=Candidatus Uabimicrobium helgolandensis TaxID=3095367 RepID=UPI0035566762
MNQQQAGGVIFAIFSIAYLFFAKDINVSENSVFSARTFPYILGICGTVISFLLIMPSPSKKSISFLLKLKWTAVFSVSVAMLLYAFLLPRLGFIIATILFLNTAFVIMGEKKWRHMFYTSFSLTCVFWLLLTQMLDIYLSPGSWWMG